MFSKTRSTRKLWNGGVSKVKWKDLEGVNWIVWSFTIILPSFVPSLLVILIWSVSTCSRFLMVIDPTGSCVVGVSGVVNVRNPVVIMSLSSSSIAVCRSTISNCYSWIRFSIDSLNWRSFFVSCSLLIGILYLLDG